jgi:uncharacterized membrane protein
MNGAYTSYDYPGGKKTELVAVNNAGTIVGQVLFPKLPFYAQQLFTLNGSSSTLIPLPSGAKGAVTVAINNNGTIVGNLYTSNPDYFTGFVYTPSIGMVPLTTVGAQSSPTGINDEELIVGTIITNSLESFPFWTCTPQTACSLEAKPALGAPHKTH